MTAPFDHYINTGRLCLRVGTFTRYKLSNDDIYAAIPLGMMFSFPLIA
jgi:hypothetical protein